MCRCDCDDMFQVLLLNCECDCECHIEPNQYNILRRTSVLDGYELMMKQEKELKCQSLQNAQKERENLCSFLKASSDLINFFCREYAANDSIDFVELFLSFNTKQFVNNDGTITIIILSDSAVSKHQIWEYMFNQFHHGLQEHCNVMAQLHNLRQQISVLEQEIECLS